MRDAEEGNAVMYGIRFQMKDLTSFNLSQMKTALNKTLPSVRFSDLFFVHSSL